MMVLMDLAIMVGFSGGAFAGFGSRFEDYGSGAADFGSSYGGLVVVFFGYHGDSPFGYSSRLMGLL